MKCHNLFSGENKKNISVCCLLKFLPRVLSIKVSDKIDILNFFNCLSGKIRLDNSFE